MLCIHIQLAEAKKQGDTAQTEMEELQNAKRKLDKEIEALRDNIEALTAENAKVIKSKKKIQEEVSVEGRLREGVWLGAGLRTDSLACSRSWMT